MVWRCNPRRSSNLWDQLHQQRLLLADPPHPTGLRVLYRHPHRLHHPRITSIPHGQWQGRGSAQHAHQVPRRRRPELEARRARDRRIQGGNRPRWF